MFAFAHFQIFIFPRIWNLSFVFSQQRNEVVEFSEFLSESNFCEDWVLKFYRGSFVSSTNVKDLEMRFHKLMKNSIRWVFSWDGSPSHFCSTKKKEIASRSVHWPSLKSNTQFHLLGSFQ